MPCFSHTIAIVIVYIESRNTMLTRDDIISGVEDVATNMPAEDVRIIIEYARRHDVSYADAFKELVQIGATYIEEFGCLPEGTYHELYPDDSQ